MAKNDMKMGFNYDGNDDSHKHNADSNMASSSIRERTAFEI